VLGLALELAVGRGLAAHQDHGGVDARRPGPDRVHGPVALLPGHVVGQLHAEQQGPLVAGHEPGGRRPVPVHHPDHPGQPPDLGRGRGDACPQGRVAGVAAVDQHEDLRAAAGQLAQPLGGPHRFGVRAEPALVGQPPEHLGAVPEPGRQHHRPGGHHQPATAVDEPGEESEHAGTSGAGGDALSSE
jgi:hypothetical protein